MIEALPAPSRVAPPTDEEASAFASSTNAFAFDLYRRLSSEGNVAISPASISLALSMTAAGARGETLAQMQRVLRHEEHPEATHQAASRLLATWNDPTREEYRLSVVNRLFAEAQYRLEEPFLALTRELYVAPIQPLDFREAPEPSRVAINDWIARQTESRISDLLPAQSITTDTRLVLTNAVYFLAKWETPFDGLLTHDAAFHPTDRESVPVPTMHQRSSFRYSADESVEMLELPYRSNELAMLVLVPRERDGLAALERTIDPTQLSELVAALDATDVAVALPKFTIEPGAPLALSRMLKDMGMVLAFDDQRADFTAMANPPDPRDRLFVSEAFHKAFVRVDEEGTEAAAATAVVMAFGGGLPAPPTITFTADHPFLFLIRDTRSGAILFMGRVVDPRR